MQETHFNTLKEYISKAYKAGMNDDQILEQLTKTGWEQQDVLSVIRSLKTQQLYSAPAPDTKPANQDAFAKNTGNNPPKYTVTNALKDGVQAIIDNLAKVLLAGLVLLAVYVVFVVATFIFSFIIGFSSFGSSLGSSIAPVVIGFIFLVIFSAWFSAVQITGMSVPVKDSMDGKNTIFKDLLSKMLFKSWRVMLVQFGLTLILVMPLLLVSLIIFFLAVSTGMPVLFNLIIFLGAVVWIFIVLLRLALAPYVALFDQSVPILKTYSKSYQLLQGGGQWFLLKFYIALLLAYFMFLIVTGLLSSVGGTSLGANFFGLIVFSVVIFLVAVTVNSVMVALYVNRSEHIDPQKDTPVDSRLVSGSDGAASGSPLSINR